MPSLPCTNYSNNSLKNKEKLGAGGTEPDPELILPNNVHSPGFTGTSGMSGDIQDTNHIEDLDIHIFYGQANVAAN